MMSYKKRYKLFLTMAYYGKLYGWASANQFYEWALNAKKHIENEEV